MDKAVNGVTTSCHNRASLRTVPTTVVKQSTNPPQYLEDFVLYKSTPQTLSLQDTKKRDRKRDSCAIRHYLLFYLIVLLVSSAHLSKRTLPLPRLLWSADIVLVVTYPPFCSDLVLLFLLTLSTGVGTVMQFSYFSVISQFTHNTVQPYRNILTVAPPPPYTKLKVGKNSVYTRPTLFVGWKERLDPCELEVAPEL